MNKHKYIRKGQRITQHWMIKDGEKVAIKQHQDFESINEAKRASRAIQINEQGATGLGVLVVRE